MQSFVDAMAKKGIEKYVAAKIESYLSLDDLSKYWRFTSKLAYKEVKRKLEPPRYFWSQRYGYVWSGPFLRYKNE